MVFKINCVFHANSRGWLPRIGYMPHLVIDGDYLGVRFTRLPELFTSDTKVVAEVATMYDNVDYGKLLPKAKFRIMEGTIEIGRGEVIESL